MIDLTNVNHHPAVEELAEVLSNRTQNGDKPFFRCVVAYFLAKMASNMRAMVITFDQNEIPVNIYAMLLANSGHGKNHSINVMEKELIRGFKARYREDTLGQVAEQSIWDAANDLAARKNTSPQDEFDKLVKFYQSKGTFLFDFDSGTAPALKQMREKLLIGRTGAMSLQIDEIGLNLLGNAELLTLYLELFDSGLTKTKLIKESKESTRGDDLDGPTPANMLLFGAPSRVFDGGKTEAEWNAFLETGYARRCLFAFGVSQKKDFHSQSATEIVKKMGQPKNLADVKKWRSNFQKLADPGMHDWKMTMDEEVTVQLITYKLDCEKAAEELPTHLESRRAELAHRFMKAQKLAGAFAFVDGSNEIELDHINQAIKLVEESGTAFYRISNQEQPHVRLAKFMVEHRDELSWADLIGHMPSLPGASQGRNDRMNMAIAWGYKNNVIIKKSFVTVGNNTIDLFQAESLKETDLGNMILSYSDNWSYDYAADESQIPFDQLHVLVQQDSLQWSNHLYKDGHRREDNVIPGFNMIVFDIDDGMLQLAHDLLAEIMFMTYTTKRHTDEANRFRLIIPINFNLALSKDEYSEMMNSIISWLPFPDAMVIDPASTQRAKTWATHEGTTYHYNLTGEVLNVLPFIPRTSKNEEFQKQQKAIGSMDNLERWFATRMVKNVNRNNTMIKYALCLVDGGLSFDEVSSRVMSFNKKIQDPMEESELNSSIMVTVAKAYSKSA